MPRSVTSTITATWLFLELALLYITVPVLLWLGIIHTGYRLAMLAGICLLVAGICFLLNIPRTKLGLGKSADTTKAILVGVCAFGIVFAAWVILMSLLGRAPLPMIRSNPDRLLTIICLYWMSALAQEFLIRAFFFHRYKSLLKPGALILLNAAVFAFVHIVYGSWVSVVMSFPLGLFLAWLYQRYPSLVAVTITHYLFGLLVFAGGLGGYFFKPF